MSEIKYEPVFGPQELFNGTMDDCEFVRGDYGYKIDDGKLFYCEKHNQKYGWCKSSNSALDLSPVSAMRRIIRTPTWTAADQKAGRLPEVGSTFTYKNETLTCHFIDCDGEVWAHDINDRVVTPRLKDCKPIESPEEKAKRLRDEWKNNVIEIHHGKRRKMSTSTFLLDDIYDALLSGELAAPKGGE